MILTCGICKMWAVKLPATNAFITDSKNLKSSTIVEHVWNKLIIIRCKCCFLFIGQEPTTWPANNCLQMMTCSCAMLFNCFWLQILFCSCVNETTLAPRLFMWSLSSLLGRQRVLTAFQRYYLLKNKLSDRMIKQYYYWTQLLQNIMICQCLADQ